MNFGYHIMPPPISPLRKSPHAWFEHIKRQFGIHVQRPDQNWSPSSTQTIHSKCYTCANFLFYKHRPKLDLIESQLRSCDRIKWTIDELFRLLKDQYNQNRGEFQSPISSQSKTITRIDSHETPAFARTPITPSLNERLDHAKTPLFAPPSRPKTPEPEDPDTEEDDYDTAPQSPSMGASLRLTNRKRSSPSGVHASSRRKFSRTASGSLEASPTKLRNAISAESSYEALPPSQFPSFEGTNNVLLRSFETTITIPDVAPPPSSYGPTSSDYQAFENIPAKVLPSRTSRSSRPSEIQDDSSLLYGVTSSVDIAMEQAAHRLEQRERELAQIEEDDSEILESQDGVVEDFRIRDLPKQGFFLDEENVKSNLPFHIQYECARISQETGISFKECIDTVPDNCTYDSFWAALLHLCRQYGKRIQKSLDLAWDSADGASTTAKLFLTPTQKTLMRTTLVRGDLARNSRFHKKFGRSRFLYLYLPDFKEIEHKPGARRLQKRLRQWMMREKHWLGRTWRAFHVEATQGRDMLRGESFSYRVVFFAISGIDLNIPTVRIEDLIHWFIDLDNPENQASSFCKIYARIPLALSNTRTAYCFHPAQVLEVRDMTASRHPEPRKFNDTTSGFDWSVSYDPRITMNDGCSLISLGAAIEVWKGLGQSGPIPSVFQARINGAKGIWIRSADISTATAHDKKIWIQVNESQRKFSRHSSDTDASYEPLRWSFEVVGWSRKALAASLHQSFIPILEDRGVPRYTIKDLVAESLEAGRTEVMQAMNHPVRLRAWLENSMSSRSANEQIPLGCLPNGYVSKAILLLDSGMDPRNNRFLADLLYEILWSHFTRRIINVFAVPLTQSTIVKGIADWTGTLKPGEIHLAFSRPFVTAENEECHFLNGQETLVTRHPCLRASDIQKVVARYTMELSHVRDVVVFSALGPTPLASKLQGGDYDGDDFWMCWDSSLVKPFKNAPSPKSSPQLEALGIEVNRQTLSQIMYAPPHERSVDQFLEEAFKFSLQPSLLGLVTDYHDRLVYKTNNIRNPGAQALADIHGLIIDSTKNGYTYTRDCFLSWLKTNRIVEGQQTSIEEGSSNLPERAWKANIEEWVNNHERKREMKSSTLFRTPSEKKAPKRNLNQIHDYLHFEVIEPHVKETLERVKGICDSGSGLDPDLCRPYHNLLLDKGSDQIIQAECENMKDQLLQIRDYWSASPLLFEEKVLEVRDRFERLAPSTMNACHPVIEQWTKSISDHAPCFWSFLKASALYDLCRKNITFVWHTAGVLLCKLKAESFPRTHHIVHAQYMNLRPRKEAVVDGNEAAPIFIQPDNAIDFQSCHSEVDTEFYSVPEF